MTLIFTTTNINKIVKPAAHLLKVFIQYHRSHDPIPLKLHTLGLEGAGVPAHRLLWPERELPSQRKGFASQLVGTKPCGMCTLQRKSHTCVSFLGISRPQSQFPHSRV